MAQAQAGSLAGVIGVACRRRTRTRRGVPLGLLQSYRVSLLGGMPSQPVGNSLSLSLSLLWRRPRGRLCFPARRDGPASSSRRHTQRPHHQSPARSGRGPPRSPVAVLSPGEGAGAMQWRRTSKPVHPSAPRPNRCPPRRPLTCRNSTAWRGARCIAAASATNLLVINFRRFQVEVRRGSVA